MAEVVIVGGGIGGLAAALLLGRQGREVVVCERDAAPVPQSTEEMWAEWRRPGTPQAPLGHTFLPGFRTLLAARAPDVLQRLLAGGAPLVDYSEEMPGDERRPEDAELHAIMCRRAVLEGILRQTVEAEPTVELRCGCDVAGLIAEPSTMPGVPRIISVQDEKRGRDRGGHGDSHQQQAGAVSAGWGPSATDRRRSAPRGAGSSASRASSGSGCEPARTTASRRG